MVNKQQWTRLHLNRRLKAFGVLWAAIVSALTARSLFWNPDHADNSLFSFTTWLPLDNEVPDVQHLLVESTGRILITGGGGNIGKFIVRRLLSASIPVTVLDTIFFDDELQSIQADFPASHGLLEVVIGDIRNETTLASVLKPDVSGVINLAAVSRVLWCLENTADCDDVNVVGTDLVLEAMRRTQAETGSNPWFIQASSREVYGSAEVYPVTEDSPKIPANVYGASKLRAEAVIERHIMERGSQFEGQKLKKLNAIALRLSNVYGGEFDHRERLIPAIMTQAMSHEPIQIVGGAQDLDMVHIDDVVDAFMLAVRRLEGFSRPSFWPWSASSGQELEAFNVVAGGSVPVMELVRKIIGLTRSDSPLQMIPGDNRFPDRYIGSGDKAERVLGYRSRVSLDEGLHRLAKRYLAQTADYIGRKIEDQCTSNTYATADLTTLDSCTGMISTSIDGDIAYLQSRLISADSPWIWQDGISPEIFVFGVTKQDGLPHLTIHDSEDPNRIFTFGSDSSFKVNLDEATGFIALSLKNDEWLAPPGARGGHALSDSKMQHRFRLTTLCCANKPAPWLFYADSPLISAINDLKTETQHRFDASPLRTRCDRLHKAKTLAEGKLRLLDEYSLPIVLEEAPLPQGAPGNWKRSEWPTCTNICDLPSVCVDTGSCACATSNCIPRQRFPFASTANLPMLSYPSEKLPESVADDPDALSRQVAGMSWLNVLRPQIARFVTLDRPYPPMNVTLMPPAYQADRDANATKYDELKHGGMCFSADSVMERGAKAISSDYSKDSLVFLPNFSGVMYHPPVEQFWTNAIENNLPADFKQRNAIVPFAHDWGICHGFVWNIFDIRNGHWGPNLAAEQSTAWSVMGDLNSNCYRPHQDVVIPSRTCQQDELRRLFGDVAHVKPIRQRTVLATFSGTQRGTGIDLRRRVGCSRPFTRSDYDVRLKGGQELPVFWNHNPPGLDYLQSLNETVFCPLPRGTTGWATRTIDVIYAGCIPVVFGDQTHHIFWRSLNWAKFSVSIDETEVDRLEEVLLSYSWAELALMQANLMLIRDALLYPSEGHLEENLQRRGPFSFAMQETSLLSLTTYPE